MDGNAGLSSYQGPISGAHNFFDFIISCMGAEAAFGPKQVNGPIQGLVILHDAFTAQPVAMRIGQAGDVIGDGLEDFAEMKKVQPGVLVKSGL